MGVRDRWNWLGGSDSRYLAESRFGEVVREGETAICLDCLVTFGVRNRTCPNCGGALHRQDAAGEGRRCVPGETGHSRTGRPPTRDDAPAGRASRGHREASGRCGERSGLGAARCAIDRETMGRQLTPRRRPSTHRRPSTT